MKIFVFSDLHGYADTFQKILDAIGREQPNKVVFCGDLFGGWSGTEKIVALTKQIDAVTYFVRGNNDIFYPNVDVDFEEYALMHHFGKTMFFSHGHIFSPDNLPPMRKGDVFISGHIHVPVCQDKNGILCLNPGSVSIPKEDSHHGYMTFEDGKFIWKDFDGNIIDEFNM